MRSLKAERKPSRRSAAKQARRSTTGSRIPLDRLNFGRRKGKKNPVAKMIEDLRAYFTLRRPMLLLTLGLVAFTGVFALFAGGYVNRAIRAANDGIDSMIADSGFAVSAIHIAGERHTPPQAVLAALGFAPGQTIFSADLWRARAKLLKLDWVARATVTRRYPDQVAVNIVEKEPFALWKSPDGFFVIERSGARITGQGLSLFARLPVLAGPGAAVRGAELIDAIRAHRAVAARVRVMQRVSDRRWNLILDDGVIVKLPETGWRGQLDVLEHLIVDKAILERDIGEIDLRAPDNFIFILKNGREQRTAREKAA